MSLRLLIDEDTQAIPLVTLLRAKNHDILTIGEAGHNGIPDYQVMELAKAENRILLTHNCDDFRELHRHNSHHPGIIAIYKDQDQTKNMTRSQIVTALGNLEASGWKPEMQFIALNAWNY